MIPESSKIHGELKIRFCLFASACFSIRIAVSCVTAPDGNHTVYIRDNGIGIGEPHEPSGHYGLNIMRERAERLSGTLTFSQPSGGGTLVSISFRSAESDGELT